MIGGLSQRLLTLLQFTRIALVFTAISNSACTLLLATARHAPPGVPIVDCLDWRQIVSLAAMSTGLYAFGMSLNDIIDRRRDQQLASHRPLPSGRLRLLTAHLLCTALGLMALAAGGYYASIAAPGWRSFVILLWTAILIVFYDFAGKYLVGIGLLTLGLIRFFHAVIPAPQLPLLWHPLLLYTHVAVLSTVAYSWEEKRPPLTLLQWRSVLGGVAAVDLLAVAIVLYKCARAGSYAALGLRPALAVPAALVGIFILIGWQIWRTSPTRRAAGQRLMLAGLLYLIVYDSAFAGAYVGWLYGLGLVSLAILSYLAVLVMRWWSSLLQFSQQPDFKRVRTTR